MMLFQYRGIRIHPWMKELHIIIPLSFTLPLLLPAGGFAFVNRRALQVVELEPMIITVVLLAAGIALGLLLTRAFIECTALGVKIDRLCILSRYLYDHRLYYEKKGQGQEAKLRIKYPKVYLKQRRYDCDVTFEMAGNKFQEKFKKMGGELETSFFMDFMETSDERKFKTYTMAYSAFLNRINVPEVTYEKGKGLKLMKNFYWDFTSDPHMIVAGGTGGGKTVLLRTLVLGLAKIGVVDICDPKYADFVTMAELEAFKGRVVFTTEDIVTTFEKAQAEMAERYRIMNEKRQELHQKELGKYSDYGMTPYFLVCDEFNALMSVVKSDTKLAQRFDIALTELVLKGRQAGVNVILAMQKPSREDLSSKMQANMNMRLVVGRLDGYGYEVMFGELNRTKDFKYIKRLMGRRIYGRGYAAIMGDVAREFYAPNLAKGFVFYDEYAKLERIPDPYSPIENPNITSKKAELSSEEKAKPEEEKLSLTQVSKDLNVSRPQLFKAIKLLEDNTELTFDRNANNQPVLSSEEVQYVQRLFALKTTFELSWQEAIQEYISQEG